MGVFYEGGSSELVEIDNTAAHLYLYENTVSVEEVGEPLEGRLAHRLVHAGGDWWGMGVHWSSPRDLSGWASLHASFRSESLAEIEIGLNGAADDRHVVLATDYGYAADGEWHTLQIPLADFAAKGLDLAAVTSPLSLGGPKAEAGDFVLIDNLYFDMTPGSTAAAGAGRRLSIGVFYEGASSELVEIDNATAHLYLYDNTVSVQETDEAPGGTGRPPPGPRRRRLVGDGRALERSPGPLRVEDPARELPLGEPGRHRGRHERGLGTTATSCSPATTGTPPTGSGTPCRSRWPTSPPRGWTWRR